MLESKWTGFVMADWNVTRPTGSERFDTDKGEVTIKYFFSSKKQLLLKQGGAWALEKLLRLA